jgi:hypothetical protein
VLRVYRQHYNEHRPYRALRLMPPDGRDRRSKRLLAYAAVISSADIRESKAA